MKLFKFFLTGQAIFWGYVAFLLFLVTATGCTSTLSLDVPSTNATYEVTFGVNKWETE